MFPLTFIVHSLVLYSTIEYFGINMVLHKSRNIYICWWQGVFFYWHHSIWTI